MNVGHDGKVSSNEFLRYEHSHCLLCEMDGFEVLHIPRCCEYHSKKHRCLHGRRISHCIPEIDKSTDEKTTALDVSIVKNCSRAVQAIVDNDLSFLTSFLDSYPTHIDALLPYDPKFTYDHTGKKFTLLQIAIIEDNPEAVELILKFQPDTDKKPYPLLLACHRLYNLKYEFLTEYKICHSKKIHDIIRLLLAHGVNPNVLYLDRYCPGAPQTPLTYCMLVESTQAVNMLLAHGAKPLPDVPTDDSSAPVSTAFSNEILPHPGQMVDEKATGYDLHVSNGQLQEQEMAQIVRQIFCTYLSVEEYYVDIYLKKLIEHGLDINAYYGDLKPIHFACIPPSSLKAVKLLLEHGVDINDQDKNGEFTALHQLILSKSECMTPEFVEELLSFGADFYIKGRIPVKNSNVIPPHLIDIYKSRHPLIFKKGKSYTALELLPPEFPSDIFFCESKQQQKTAKPLNTRHNTADKEPATDKKPPATTSGATSNGHHNYAQPSQLQYPAPSCPGYDSDEDSHPPPFNPYMGYAPNVDDLPPSYSSLYLNNESPKQENPKHKSPKKKSWFFWKRK